MLQNCPNLENILSTLDDGSDFYKIFAARNQFDENDVILSLEEIFNIITKRQQTEPLTLLLDWYLNLFSLLNLGFVNL